ncbi:MAG TPA: DUF2007 domain-containing protein [Tissierellaceae bacterium]|nr:DUF2007 domain-containing protein [Tissierellaceae bacterium]
MKTKKLELIILKSTNDDCKLSIIKSLLNCENIPYVLKGRGNSEYMKVIGGTSVYPTDILVEESAYDKAKEILDNFPGT